MQGSASEPSWERKSVFLGKGESKKLAGVGSVNVQVCHTWQVKDWVLPVLLSPFPSPCEGELCHRFSLSPSPNPPLSFFKGDLLSCR